MEEYMVFRENSEALDSKKKKKKERKQRETDSQENEDRKRAEGREEVKKGHSSMLLST